MKDWQEIEESDKLQDQILAEIENRVKIENPETLFPYIKEVKDLIGTSMSIKQAVNELMKDTQGLLFDEKFELLKGYILKELDVKDINNIYDDIYDDVAVDFPDYHEMKESEKLVHMNNDEILKLAHELVKEIL